MFDAFLQKIWGYAERTLVVGWGLFVAGFFLLPKQPTLKIVFYLLLVLPSLLLVPVWWKERARLSSPLLLCSLFFSLYMATTFFWSGEPWGEWWFFFYKQVIFIMFWLLATVWVSIRFPEFYRQFPVWLVWLGAIVALVTLLVYFYNDGGGLSRMNGLGVLNNQLVAAQAFGALGLMAFILSVQVNSKGRVTVFLVCGVVCYTAVIMTQSRGPVFYFLICGLLILLAMVFLKRAREALAFLALLSICFVFFYMFGVFDALIQRLDKKSPRLVIWRKMLSESGDVLWFGKGVRRFTDFSTTMGDWQHSHNVFIDTLRFGGVVCVVFLMVIIIISLRGVLRNFLNNPFYIWLLFGLLCMLTNGKFLLVRPDWSWLLFWVPVGFICAQQAADSRQNEIVAGEKD